MKIVMGIIGNNYVQMLYNSLRENFPTLRLYLFARESIYSLRNDDREIRLWQNRACGYRCIVPSLTHNLRSSIMSSYSIRIYKVKS